MSTALSMRQLRLNKAACSGGHSVRARTHALLHMNSANNLTPAISARLFPDAQPHAVVRGAAGLAFPGDELAARVNHLADGRYLLWQPAIVGESPRICLRASEVTATQLYVTCPFCWTSRKKNGAPAAGARHVVHSHGSGGNRRPRVEFKEPDCVDIDARVEGASERIRPPTKCGEYPSYVIYVTPNTTGVQLSNNNDDDN